MGLSRKKTNLAILRSKLRDSSQGRRLRDITVGSGVAEEPKQEDTPKPVVNGKLIKEAKRAGRKKNELIDGSRLLTC